MTDGTPLRPTIKSPLLHNQGQSQLIRFRIVTVESVERGGVILCDLRCQKRAEIDKLHSPTSREPESLHFTPPGPIFKARLLHDEGDFSTKPCFFGKLSTRRSQPRHFWCRHSRGSRVNRCFEDRCRGCAILRHLRHTNVSPGSKAVGPARHTKRRRDCTPPAVDRLWKLDCPIAKGGAERARYVYGKPLDQMFPKRSFLVVAPSILVVEQSSSENRSIGGCHLSTSCGIPR
ncbi:unnamed protein product [Ectocarpus sp. 13 AM-2016]